MRRRARGFVLAVAACILAVPLASGAQQPGKVPRIGVLSGGSRNDDRCLVLFRRGLSELGYSEGKTHTLEPRWAEGKVEPFPRMAAELVRLKVDLIVAFTGHRSIRDATASIPIVMAVGFYPVETGVVASLARPGGNITGVAMWTPGLMAKRVQILKEAVPKVSRVAVLRLEGGGDNQDLMVKDFEAAARQLGVQLQVIAVGRSENLSGAFETAVRGGAGALMTTQMPFFAINRAQIAELALKHRLPSLSGEVGAADAGTLLFFGPNIGVAGCQRAAVFVDRILKGAKPAELPVEQPAVVELVVNLKTAKALGLAIPQSILRRADRVIE